MTSMVLKRKPRSEGFLGNRDAVARQKEEVAGQVRVDVGLKWRPTCRKEPILDLWIAYVGFGRCSSVPPVL